MEITKSTPSGGRLAAIGAAFIVLLIAWIPFYNWIGAAWQISDNSGAAAIDAGTGATVAQAVAGSIFWLLIMAALAFVIARFSGGWLVGWQTRELVTVALLGAIFGAIFNGWTLITSGPLSAFNVYPWNSLLGCIWFIPGFLAPYIIRKPGAALFAEGIAAFVSFLLGSPWGFLGAVVAGLVQGLGAEVAFAMFGWRRYNLLVMGLAGLLSAVASFAFVYPIWYATYDTTTNLLGLVATIGGALIGVALSIAIAQALKATGVLDRFALVRGKQHG